MFLPVSIKSPQIFMKVIFVKEAFSLVHKCSQAIEQDCFDLIADCWVAYLAGDLPLWELKGTSRVYEFFIFYWLQLSKPRKSRPPGKCNELSEARWEAFADGHNHVAQLNKHECSTWLDYTQYERRNLRNILEPWLSWTWDARLSL